VSLALDPARQVVRQLIGTQGYDSIIEHVLVPDPDFSDLDTLTKQIESETLIFIRDVERSLSKH
jgi:hypothetical protein